MKWKEFIGSYFVFTKKERVGVYVLSGITLLVWIVPYLFSKDQTIEEILEVNYVDMDSAAQVLLSINPQFKPRKTRNTLDSAMRSSDASMQQRNRIYNQVVGISYNKQKLHPIDINKADSIQFEKLPAIGEKLSSRIVRYRDRLGGFLQPEQLKEVYGISDSSFYIFYPYLKIEEGFVPQKISINKVDYSALRRHPYANHEFTKLVLAYRKTHGPFSKKADMEKIIQIDLNVLEKIAPYLNFEY